MENSRSKKAVAASLSLALALGSVPAVALADTDQDNKDIATQNATDTENKITVSVNFVDENWQAISATDIDVPTSQVIDAGYGYLGDKIQVPSGYEAVNFYGDGNSAYVASDGSQVTVQVKKIKQAAQDVNFTYAVGYGDSQK